MCLGALGRRPEDVFLSVDFGAEGGAQCHF